MYKCPQCNIKVNGTNCPLCGKYNGEEKTNLYPKYERNRDLSVKKFFSFFSIVAGIIVILLDYLTIFEGWSLIVCAGLILNWYMLIKPIIDKTQFTTMVVHNVFLTCFALLIVELVGAESYTGWPSSYMMPSVIALGITMIIFASIIRTVKWSEISASLLSLALLNAVLVVLGIFTIIPDMTLALIVQVFSILCLFGLKHFLSKSFNEEFRKKMHM